MGEKLLLREFYALCPDGVCDVSLLTEEERKLQAEGKNMFLTGILQRADDENGNGRIYPYDILKREDERYQQLIRENRALGELDHPDESIVSIQNASHMVMETWWKGKELWGKIKILSNSVGRDVQAMVRDGVQLGISSRGMGSVRENNDGSVIVENNFQLLCYDLVSDPSTTGAFMRLNENKAKKLYESFYKKEDRIIVLMEDILR